MNYFIILAVALQFVVSCSKGGGGGGSKKPTVTYSAVYQYPTVNLNPGDGKVEVNAASIVSCKDNKGFDVNPILCPPISQAPVRIINSPAGTVTIPVNNASGGFVQIPVSEGEQFSTLPQTVVNTRISTVLVCDSGYTQVAHECKIPGYELILSAYSAPTLLSVCSGTESLSRSVIGCRDNITMLDVDPSNCSIHSDPAPVISHLSPAGTRNVNSGANTIHQSCAAGASSWVQTDITCGDSNQHKDGTGAAATCVNDVFVASNFSYPANSLTPGQGQLTVDATGFSSCTNVSKSIPALVSMCVMPTPAPQTIHLAPAGSRDVVVGSNTVHESCTSGATVCSQTDITCGAVNQHKSGSGATATCVDDEPIVSSVAQNGTEDSEVLITLPYTGVTPGLATACAISAPSGVTESTPCSCVLGVCSVGVTGTQDLNGPTTFSYTVTANGYESNVGSATITLAADDDAPVSQNVSESTAEETPVTVTLSYSDVESDEAETCSISNLSDLTVSSSCACASGVCSVEVTPSQDFNGSASFDYTVSSLGKTSNSSSADVTVTAVDDAPVAVATSESTTEDVPVLVTLSYSDVENDQATSCSITNLSNLVAGPVCSCAAGVCSATVSPVTDFNGNASFDFTVTANGQASNSATATIAVAPANDPSVAQNVSESTSEDTQVMVTLSYTDTESDEADSCSTSGLTNLTVSSACSCTTGVCSVGVTPTSNFNGSASFSYTVTSNGQASNSATATVTVSAVDDAPVTANITGVMISSTTGFNVNLPYTDPENDSATSCQLTGATNVEINTCSCAAGVCTANIKRPAAYSGAASINYAVTANGQQSNSSSISITMTATLATISYPKTSYGLTTGSAATLTPTITNPDAVSVGCTISPALVSPLALNASTCVISGTPSTTSNTDHTITITSTEGGTQIGTTTFAVKIKTGGMWSTTGNMTAARTNPEAVLLDDGRVMVAGGSNGSAALASAEIYNPATNTWSAITSMTGARQNFVMHTTDDGRVLAIGGETTASAQIATVQIYDIGLGSWSAGAAIPQAKGETTSVKFPNGKILVANGAIGGAPSQTSYVYDPDVNSWTSAGNSGYASMYPGSALLPDGKVLLAGGGNASFVAVATSRLYDPSNNTWSAAGNMTTARMIPNIVLMDNGRVFANGTFNPSTKTNESYNPATNTWTGATGSASNGGFSSLTKLNNGKLLLLGGDSLSQAVLYDPTANTWTNLTSMSGARYQHRAVKMADGRVLVIGGRVATAVSASVLIFDPDYLP